MGAAERGGAADGDVCAADAVGGVGGEESIFDPIKPALLVYLKSSSGRIPAGVILLPVCKPDAPPTREMARIEKCPDKHATLEYEARLERVGEGESRQYPAKLNRTVSPELPLSRTPSQLYLRQSQI